ncbi:MAG: putative methyltransferase [Rhodoglobus sp.]|nr:putative methyltransferase [Rhodoglobus sp.]
MEIEAGSLDELLRAVYPKLLEAEKVLPEPRQGANRELRGVVLRLSNPRARLSRTMKRGRAFSGIGELAWYLAGSDETAFVARYISAYLKYDVGGRVPSAYGPRLFGAGVDAQIANLVDLLRAHPSTRRAVAQVFDRHDLPASPVEVPCTCSIQFLLREGRLDAVVHMRSNDAYIGLPHDIFAFTMIQELVANALGVDLGAYVHMVSSLHLYERNEEPARGFLGEGKQTQDAMPIMTAGDPWEGVAQFLEMEKSARDGTANIDTWPSGYWTDLALMCAARCSGDAAEILRIRSMMTEPFWELYLTDLAFDLEDPDEVVA